MSSSAIKRSVHSGFVGSAAARHNRSEGSFTRYNPGELTVLSSADVIPSGRTQGAKAGSWDVMRSRVPGVGRTEIQPVRTRFPVSRTPRGRRGSNTSSAGGSSSSYRAISTHTVSIRSPSPEPPPNNAKSRKAQKGPAWGRMAADPFDVSITSDAAKEWRTAWTTENLTTGSDSLEALMHPSNVRPQAVLPRTSRNAGHSLRQKSTPASTSSSTAKHVGDSSSPRRRGLYGHRSRHMFEKHEVGGGATSTAASASMALAEDSHSPTQSSPPGGGWGDMINARQHGGGRAGAGYSALPTPGELGLYMDTPPVPGCRFTEMKLLGGGQVLSPTELQQSPHRTLAVTGGRAQSASGHAVFDTVLDESMPKVPRHWTGDTVNPRRKAPAYSIRTGAIRGAKPRWKAPPLKREHEVVHLDVFPDPPPPPEPNGYKWIWLDEWSKANVEEILRDQLHESDYIRARACCLTRGLFDVSRRDILPTEALEGVKTRGMSDASHSVRFEAAMTLVSLGISSEEASALLFYVLSKGNGDDRWRAARCLASVGACTFDIAKVLLEELAKGKASHQDQATALLIALSESSNVIRVSTVEMLNSLDHRERHAAIMLVRELHGPTGMDCADKLLSMMWEDWHVENRIAAAEALGLSGNGSVMHDDLLLRLSDPLPRIRSDAVKKLAEIQRITPGLTPPFLARFTDTHVMVRIEACVAAAVIEPRQIEVVEALLLVLMKDASTTARCTALTALASFNPGVLPKTVVETVAWTIKWCKDDEVVIYAMRTAGKLGFTQPAVVEGLISRTKDADTVKVKAEGGAVLRLLDCEPKTKEDENEIKMKSALVDMCTLNHTQDFIFQTEAIGRSVDSLYRFQKPPTKKANGGLGEAEEKAAAAEAEAAAIKAKIQAQNLVAAEAAMKRLQFEAGQKIKAADEKAAAAAAAAEEAWLEEEKCKKH